MFIVFGSRNMGETDAVPGVFHVATRFYHVQYLPLVPQKSFLVVPSLGNRAVEIPLSRKSVGVAWLRVNTFFLHFGTMLWLLLGSIDNLDEGFWMFLMFLGMFGILSAPCICGGKKLRNGMLMLLAVALILGSSLYFVQGSLKKIAAPLVAFILAGALNVWSLWSKTTRYATYDRATELCAHFGPRGGPAFQRVINNYFQQQTSASTEFVAVAQAEMDDGADGFPLAVAEPVVDIEACIDEEPPIKATTAEIVEGVV